MRMLLAGNGGIHIEDAAGFTVGFRGPEDLLFYSGVELTAIIGGHIVGYEPDRGIHTWFDGINTEIKPVPFAAFDELIDQVQVLRARQADRFYKKSLAEIKAGMWDTIKAERDRRITGGGFKVEVSPGVFKWFHSDGHSRIQHLGLKDEVRDTTGNDPDVLVLDGEQVAWKTMDGDFVLMTRKLVKDIVKAAKITDKRLFKVAEIHKAAMEASTDPAKYDYHTGWPEAFGE